jgi:hypothetical protein
VRAWIGGGEWGLQWKGAFVGLQNACHPPPQMDLDPCSLNSSRTPQHGLMTPWWHVGDVKVWKAMLDSNYDFSRIIRLLCEVTLAKRTIFVLSKVHLTIVNRQLGYSPPLFNEQHIILLLKNQSKPTNLPRGVGTCYFGRFWHMLDATKIHLWLEASPG